MSNQMIDDKTQAQLYNKNWQWLKKILNAETINSLTEDTNNIKVLNKSIYIGEQRIYEDIEKEIIDPTMKRFESSRNIRMVQMTSDDTTRDPYKIASNIIASINFSLLSSLPICDKEYASNTIPKGRNFICLGSLSLLTVDKVIEKTEKGNNDIINSITLIESEQLNFDILINIIDLEDFVKKCKFLNIGFHMIFKKSSVQLIEHAFDYFADIMPCQLFKLSMLKQDRLSPELIEFDSWIFSESGIGHRYVGSFGFSTDEINQIINSSLNYHQYENYKHIKYGKVLNSDYQAIAIGSGPSLDKHLSWLKANSDKFITYSSASSVRSLLVEKIRPDYLVITERNTIVYDNLEDLREEFPDVGKIKLLCADTVDPRVTSIFEEVIFFQRPRSTVSAIYSLYNESSLPTSGPEAVNGSIEAAFVMGFRNILLLGCDFGAIRRGNPRAKNAFGLSPRELDTPVKGNLGRTVFSQSSLLFVRDSVERLLIAAPDLNITRSGEGAELKGSKNINLLDNEETRNFVKSKIKIDTIKLQKDCVNISPAPMVKEELEKYKYELVKVINEIKEVLIETEDWSITLERELSKFLYAGLIDINDTNYALAARRSIRQCLYHSLHILCNNSSEAEKFKSAKIALLESIELIKKAILIVIDAIIDRIESKLIDSNDWTPEKTKMTIQMMAENAD